jgi:hypothetical protein
VRHSGQRRHRRLLADLDDVATDAAMEVPHGREKNVVSSHGSADRRQR